VEQEVGQVTPELRNYMTKNPSSAEFKQILKHSRVQDSVKTHAASGVKPMDVVYHRGTKQERVIVNDDSIN
jgi:hypothetical protein